MGQATPTVLLEHYLKTLRLPTMRREHGKLAAVCQAERADYATYLLRLAERGVQDREVRAAERRVQAVRFPVLKTLDTFEFAAQPSINQAGLRAHEPVGFHQLALREMDRGPGYRAAHGRPARAPHTPHPHPGSQRREPPPARIAAAAQTATRGESDRDRNVRELDTRRQMGYL